MKDILANLAMIDLLTYCKAHDIDCSGTHLYKYPRAYRYALIRTAIGKAILTVSFYKNSVPLHSLPK